MLVLGVKALSTILTPFGGLFLFLPLLEIHIPVIPTMYNLGQLTGIL